MVSEHACLAITAGMPVRCSLSTHTPSPSFSPFARHSLSSTCITAAQHHMCPSSNRFIELMARFDLMPPAFQRVQHAHVEWCGFNRQTPRIASITPRKPLTHTHTNTHARAARTHARIARWLTVTRIYLALRFTSSVHNPTLFQVRSAAAAHSPGAAANVPPRRLPLPAPPLPLQTRCEGCTSHLSV